MNQQSTNAIENEVFSNNAFLKDMDDALTDRSNN